MATFIKRRKKNGTLAVTAQIRIKQQGRVVHHETRTFSKATSKENDRQARIWAKRREAAIELNGIPQPKHTVTLAELAQEYLNDPAITRKGRTKTADIKRLSGYEIAQQPIIDLTITDYTAHTDWRLTQAQPQTVTNDLIWIAELRDYATGTRNITGTRPILDDARRLLRKTGKIARSRQRERLPTPEEHARLLEWFARPARSGYPMLDILLFAMYSARRESEITRLYWADNNDRHQTGLIRDLKDPRNTAGNHQRFNYTAEAWQIAQRQPRENERIFPFYAKTIGAYFTRACHINEIDDLHFHDYRHWAVSYQFVSGLQIHEVAAVSLHSSWNTLKRYTHQTPEERDQIKGVDQVTKDFCLDRCILLCHKK